MLKMDLAASMEWEGGHFCTYNDWPAVCSILYLILQLCKYQMRTFIELKSW